jgi:hypothetical protein
MPKARGLRRVVFGNETFWLRSAGVGFRLELGSESGGGGVLLSYEQK